MLRTQIALTLGLILATGSAAAYAPVRAQDWSKPQTDASLEAAAKARAHNPNKPAPWWPEAAKQPDAWYRGEAAKVMAANILSWQDKALGGWPLMNTTREPFTGDETKAGPWGIRPAMIKATVNEIRFMARAFNATGDERYNASALRGINFILKAQYPTGGWPHSYPVRDDYTKWATYNDDMMPDLMTLLNEVATQKQFEFAGAAVRRQAKDAFDRGVDFILKTQIVVDGKLTAWAQQHDQVTYAPRPARVFEPAALTGGESASVLYLLMSIDQPSPAVRKSITSGVDWYRKSQINGLKLTVGNGDRVVTPDPSAPPIWARYYDIKTGKPVFVGRDGVIRDRMADIEKERRGGYAWYNYSGTALFKAYDQWKVRHPA